MISAQLTACTDAMLDTSLQYDCCVCISRGFAANGILLIFYASPLSAMLKVLQTRSSAPIHLGMAVMTVLNGESFLVGQDTCKCSTPCLSLLKLMPC